MKRIILKATNAKDSKQKGGKVFYTVLFAAIVTVGTTAYVMSSRNRAIEKIDEKPASQHISATSFESAPIRIEVPDEFATESQMVSEELWQSDDVIPVTEEATENTVEEIPEITSMSMPVENGDISKPHSDTELYYSKTMDDWRLHKGIDIDVPIGATVSATAKGVVSECYTDTAYGVTVVIDHGNGLYSKYSNLASDKMVKTGQTVEPGTAIGVVGDTAEFEVADKAHLHFEVIKNGVCVNPEDYFD